MSRVFNYEGPLFTSLSRLADLIWLNLLFILCCIPVVTIGAAATALYYVTLKMAKDEEGYITRSYFRSFKDNLFQASVIWVLFLVIVVVMFLDLRIANGGDITKALNIGAMDDVVIVAVGVMVIILSMTMTYVFPVLARFDNTVLNTIKNSFLISVRHLPYTVVMILITIAPVALIWFFPPLLILILVMFSAVAYINSKFFVRIFAHYMPKETPSEDVDGKDGEE